MRGILIGIAVWVGLGACPPARAGVYNTHELFYLPPPDGIRSWVGELRAVALESDPRVRSARPAQPGTLRYDYLKEAELLEVRARDDTLTTVDRVNLSACSIRMRRFDDAIRVLKAGDQKHFLILANLASAYDGLGEPSLAQLYQRQALDVWPSVWAGWSEAQSQFYRRVERHYLRLLELRGEEKRSGSGRPLPMQAVDALFPGVRFVGPTGRYEAGALSQTMVDRLPPDAYCIVLQLVHWLPQDDRLYWLLGELLNANGQVDYASEVLNELVSARELTNVPELFQHRKVLMQAAPVLREWRKPEVRFTLLSALMPRSLPVPPGVGVVASEGGGVGTTLYGNWLAGLWVPPKSSASADEGSSSPPPLPWLLDWRQLSVGFACGAVLAMLGVLQWQEWRRRRLASGPRTSYQPVYGRAAQDEPGRTQG